MVLITVELNNSELHKAFKRIDQYDANVRKAVNVQVAKSAYTIHDMAIGILRSNLKSTSSRLESELRPVLYPNKYSATIKTNYKTKDSKGREYHIAELLEEGTPAHDILPVKAKALRWSGSAVAMSIGTHVRSYRTRSGGLSRQSQYRYAMKVHHPGTKAIKFIEQSVNREKPRYIEGIVKLLKTS